MTTLSIEAQISELNRKMDLVLEGVELQKRSRDEIDDLAKDLNIVAKDAFQQTVVMLDKAQVEFDSDALSSLFIKILQNVDTFHEMLQLLESARDFMKDASPILHQVGLDAVTKMNELDRKGYFIFAADIFKLMDRFILATSKVKMDDKLDNKSLFAILKELNSPEVRKSLSYSLRLLKEINN